MPIRTVERARCLSCDRDVTVTRIPGQSVWGVGWSTPEYRCDVCGYHGHVFCVHDDATFYLGRGWEIHKIPGLTSAEIRDQAP